VGLKIDADFEGASQCDPEKLKEVRDAVDADAARNVFFIYKCQDDRIGLSSVISEVSGVMWVAMGQSVLRLAVDWTVRGWNWVVFCYI